MGRTHSAEYELVLRSERYRAVRGEAIRRAGGCCRQCGRASKSLDAHHWRGYSVLGREQPEDLEILCRVCHDRRHHPGRVGVWFWGMVWRIGLAWVVLQVLWWIFGAMVRLWGMPSYLQQVFVSS